MSTFATLKKSSYNIDNCIYLTDDVTDPSPVLGVWTEVGAANITELGGQTLPIDDAAMVASPVFVPIGGEYRNAATTYADGDATILQTNANGHLWVCMSSDIQIGAVELKNGATDDRALISDANTARANTNHVLSVQHLDANGAVLPAMDTAARAGFVKLTDGTHTIDVTANSDMPADIIRLNGNAINLGTGTIGTGTQRITLATDDPAVVSLAIMDDWDDGYDHAEVVGAIADDAVDVPAQNKPVKIGAVADNIPAVVADGDMVSLITDLYCKLRIAGFDEGFDALRNNPIHSVEDVHLESQALVSTALEITNAWQNLGGELDVRKYTQVILYKNIDINASTDVRLKVNCYHTSGGSAYRYDHTLINSPDTTVSAAAGDVDNYIEYNTDQDQLVTVIIPVKGISYIKLQVEDFNNSTGQIDDAAVTMKY